ncbi:MAG: InlB B-repeat-containing protein [Clostridia bacterium]|nr:InlB B-repeat-containing protein [Clostridia bacterium]
MKKYIVFLLFICTIIATAIICGCTKDTPEPQIPEAQYYDVVYGATEGGRIIGKTQQSVLLGDDAEGVTAQHDFFYIFAGWSDGYDSAFRKDKNVHENVNVTAIFQPIEYTVEYLASDGGEIVGKELQTIRHGAASETVEAKPNEGYRFVGWSDDVLTSTRKEEYVYENVSVTAQFEKLSKTFTLDFRTADSDIIEQTVKVDYGKISEVKLPVVQKEHYTFNGWYVWGQDKYDLIADATGEIIKGNEIFDIKPSRLIPSWTANETFTYKILLVYVTEVHANVKTRIIAENRTTRVDYVMSDVERKFYKLTTQAVKSYLDDIMDGLVEFEVDEYFTTQAIRTEYFKYSSMGPERSPIIFPDNIPEVIDILNGYDSALTAFSLNNINSEFDDGAGKAESRYGQVNFDSINDAFKLHKLTLEEVVEGVDPNNWVVGRGETETDKEYLMREDWQSWIGTIIHELSHTIDERVNCYDYHKAVAELHGKQRLDDKYSNKLYYMKSVIMEGEKVGISYNFWARNIVVVKYEITGGDAYLISTRPEVVVGGYGWAKVVPYEGYRFVQWSDGLTDNERRDENVQSDMTITAILEKIE